MPEIRDITDPTEFIPEPTTPWWIWALVAFGILALIALIVLLIRKNKPKRARKTLLDKARARLEALKQEAPNLAPETVATRTSMIIRLYLESAFEDPALFETDEEFTLRPNALKALHPDTRSKITDHLKQLTNLKYEPNTAQDIANQKATGLIDEAGEILAVIELHPDNRHPAPAS
ncbi:MAG: hypothetical protein AB8F34_05585 [Akkermansiaceae bacterium]